MAAAVLIFLALALVARPCKPYTDPEGVRLLHDLRNFKGGNAPQSWEGNDPCGSLWEGVECSADGHVLNVALPDWLPQRQLLQALTEQESEILERAIDVTGTVGNINAAVGRSSGDSGTSSQAVGTTIAAIKSGLESLLPYTTPSMSAVPSPAPAPLSSSLHALTPAESPLSTFSSAKGISPASGGPAASGSSSPSMAPTTSGTGQGSSDSSQSAMTNPGDALSELLNEIELIKETLRMQANEGRKLLADGMQETLAPSAEEMMAPAVAPVLQTLPTIASPPSMTQSLPMSPDSAAGQPVEARPAVAPLQEGVNPTLLPEGDTDITAVQKAVGNDKGIGRRLAAALQFYLGSPAPGPADGYKEILAPETAPAGHGSPAKVDSKISKNRDGSTSVQLGEGSIGNFTLPTVNGTIPAQIGVMLNFGRKMLQDMKPASTLLSFSEASAPSTSSQPTGPAGGPAEGPMAGGYQEVLAPKSAPTGESSPEGLPVNLPDLQIGPVKLPAINSTLPKKQESGMPGRKRLQEAYVPMSGPAEGPWAYQEVIAPKSAPIGKASPGGVTLPDLDFGNFKLPEATLPNPPPKEEPVP